MPSKGSGNGDLMRKVLVGALIGVLVFLSTDFVLSRRADAETTAQRYAEQREVNARQDAELKGLRHDMDRLENRLADLMQVSVEILKTVKEDK